MKYEELYNEKVCIFGYTEPLVPYEKAMEACQELIAYRREAIVKNRELIVENAKLKERLRPPANLPEEDGSTSKGSSSHPRGASTWPSGEPVL